MRSEADRATLRAAQRIKTAERKAAKAARPAKVVPTAKGQREVRERDPGFLAYLRRQPCEAAGTDNGPCNGYVQAAHIRLSRAGVSRNPGMQRKPHDHHAVPLCEHHHLHDQHAGAEAAFWARLGKDPFATAAAHFAAYKGQQTEGVSDD